MPQLRAQRPTAPPLLQKVVLFVAGLGELAQRAQVVADHLRDALLVLLAHEAQQLAVFVEDLLLRHGADT